MKHDLTELNNKNCNLLPYQEKLYAEYKCQSIDAFIAALSDKIEELQGELTDEEDNTAYLQCELNDFKGKLSDAMSTIDKLEAEIQELR